MNTHSCILCGYNSQEKLTFIWSKYYLHNIHIWIWIIAVNHPKTSFRIYHDLLVFNIHNNMFLLVSHYPHFITSCIHALENHVQSIVLYGLSLRTILTTKIFSTFAWDGVALVLLEFVESNEGSRGWNIKAKNIFNNLIFWNKGGRRWKVSFSYKRDRKLPHHLSRPQEPRTNLAEMVRVKMQPSKHKNFQIYYFRLRKILLGLPNMPSQYNCEVNVIFCDSQTRHVFLDDAACMGIFE